MANIYIIIGLIFIAAGGSLATYGWNLKSSKEIQSSLEQSRVHELELQREGLIKAVFLEVIINLSILNHKKFTETNEEELSKFANFPRFRTEALTSALASALFLENKHRSFYDSVTGLLGNFDDTNKRLNRIEDSMRHLTKRPEEMSKARIAVRDGIYREDLRNKTVQFIDNIMVEKYEDITANWLLSELDEKFKSFLQERISRKKKSAN